MDLVQTLKLFVQQHLVCIGLVRSGDTPRYALNIRRNKDFSIGRGGEIGCLCWTMGLSSNCLMLCLHVLLLY